MRGRGAGVQLVAGAPVVQRHRGDGKTADRRPGRRRPPPSAHQAGGGRRFVSAVQGRLSETDDDGRDEPDAEREGVQRPDGHVQGAAGAGPSAVPPQRDGVPGQGGERRPADHVPGRSLGVGQLVAVVHRLLLRVRQRRRAHVRRQARPLLGLRRAPERVRHRKSGGTQRRVQGVPVGRRPRVPVLLPVVSQEQPVHRVVPTVRRPPAVRSRSHGRRPRRARPVSRGAHRVHRTAVRVVGRRHHRADRHQQPPDAVREQGDRGQGGRQPVPAAHRVRGRYDRHVHHTADQLERAEPGPGGGDVQVGGEQAAAHVHAQVQPDILLRRARHHQRVAVLRTRHRRHAGHDPRTVPGRRQHRPGVHAGQHHVRGADAQPERGDVPDGPQRRAIGQRHTRRVRPLSEQVRVRPAVHVHVRARPGRRPVVPGNIFGRHPASGPRPRLCVHPQPAGARVLQLYPVHRKLRGPERHVHGVHRADHQPARAAPGDRAAVRLPGRLQRHHRQDAAARRHARLHAVPRPGVHQLRDGRAHRHGLRSQHRPGLRPGRRPVRAVPQDRRAVQRHVRPTRSHRLPAAQRAVVQRPRRPFGRQPGGRLRRRRRGRRRRSARGPGQRRDHRHRRQPGLRGQAEAADQTPHVSDSHQHHHLRRHRSGVADHHHRRGHRVLHEDSHDHFPTADGNAIALRAPQQHRIRIGRVHRNRNRKQRRRRVCGRRGTGQRQIVGGGAILLII